MALIPPPIRVDPSLDLLLALFGRLWQRSMEDFLVQVSKFGFNALRIPFSVQLALAMDTTTPPENQVAGDPTLKGLTCGAILDRYG